jgi:hypothetical protein
LHQEHISTPQSLAVAHQSLIRKALDEDLGKVNGKIRSNFLKANIERVILNFKKYNKDKKGLIHPPPLSPTH